MALSDMFGTSMDDPRTAAILGLAGGMVNGGMGAGFAGMNAGLTAAAQRDLTKAQTEDTKQQMGLRNLQLQQQLQQWQLMQPILARVSAQLGGGLTPPGTQPDQATAQPPAQPAIAPTPGGPLGSGTFSIPTGGQPQVSQQQQPSNPSSASAGPSGNSSSIGGLSPDVAAYAFAGGGLGGLSKAIVEANAPTDFVKTLRNANIDPNSAIGRTMMLGQISKMNSASFRPGGYAMLNGQMVQLPHVPDGYTAVQDGNGGFQIIPVQGGTQAIQESAKASQLGKLGGTLGSGVNPATGQTQYFLGAPPGTAGATQSSNAADPFANLPQATPTQPGTFKGRPEDIVMQIANIKDPQSRADAFASFAQQLQGSGGKLPVADTAPKTIVPSLSDTAKALQDQGATAYKVATSDAQSVPQLRQMLGEIQGLAKDPNNKFGPGAPEWARVKALANNVGIDMTQAQTSQDIMGKLASNIVMSQLGQGNATGSDAQLNQLIHGNPNGAMTNEAIKQVVPLLQQQLDVREARANVINGVVNQTGNSAKVPAILNQFNRLASPPVVQLGAQIAQASKNGTIQQFIKTLTPQQRALLPQVKQLDTLGAF
jgi:hypothetical protein